TAGLKDLVVRVHRSSRKRLPVLIDTRGKQAADLHSRSDGCIAIGDLLRSQLNRADAKLVNDSVHVRSRSLGTDLKSVGGDGGKIRRQGRGLRNELPVNIVPQPLL